MVPTPDEAKKLWDIYHLPEEKRVHVSLVARVAMVFARSYPVDKNLLFVAALLHDIDKTAPKLPGERHPDAAVRILHTEGMDEVADVVATHSLHSILHKETAPKTWEQKLLYLADKMVKHDIVGVDERFALWNAEHLPEEGQHILDTSYPKVKELEHEVFATTGLSLANVVKLA